MTTIAFIGLGNMGAPMARNLIKGGLNLRVFDVIESLAVPFSDLGAQCVTVPRKRALARRWSSACCQPVSTCRRSTWARTAC